MGKDVAVSGSLMNEEAAVAIHNDVLKQAMDAVRSAKTRENEVQMFSALQNARYLLAVQTGGTDAAIQIHPFTIQTSEGVPFLPAFTDTGEAKPISWPQGVEPHFITCSLKDLEAIMASLGLQVRGIAVNPFSARIVLSRGIVTKLNTQEASAVQPDRPAASGLNVSLASRHFSEPRVYPTALINGVYEKCGTIPEVEQVWFKQMEKAGVTFFAFIVKADRYDEALETAIRDTAVPLAKDTQIEVLPCTDEIRRTVIKDAVAMYDRNLIYY